MQRFPLNPFDSQIAFGYSSIHAAISYEYTMNYLRPNLKKMGINHGNLVTNGMNVVNSKIKPQDFEHLLMKIDHQVVNNGLADITQDDCEHSRLVGKTGIRSNRWPLILLKSISCPLDTKAGIFPKDLALSSNHSADPAPES